MSISQNFPSEGDSLSLNFASSKTLDSRIIFTRPSNATYFDDNGLIKVATSNQPRFDHRFNSTTGLNESLGLLVEGSETNLLVRSQELATSPWTIIPGTGGTTTTANNVVISPDGTQNASQMNTTVWANGASVFQDVGSILGNGTYTLSVFVKGGTSNKITFAAFFTGNSTQGFSWGFNPLTGTFVDSGGVSNPTIVPYPNGWYRIYFTVTGTNTLNNTLRFQIYHASGGITYLWGAQLEAGTFPTSYIPTTTAQVTRSADDAFIPGSRFNFYNYNEGTFVVKNSFPFPNNENVNYCAFSIGQYNTLPSMEYFITFSDFPRFSYMTTSAVEYTNDPTAGAAITSSYNSACLSYTSTTTKTSMNGGVIRTTTGIPATLTRSTNNNFYIGRGQFSDANSRLNGYISQLIYYPKQLSDSQLQLLSR